MPKKVKKFVKEAWLLAKDIYHEDSDSEDARIYMEKLKNWEESVNHGGSHNGPQERHTYERSHTERPVRMVNQKVSHEKGRGISRLDEIIDRVERNIEPRRHYTDLNLSTEDAEILPSEKTATDRGRGISRLDKMVRGDNVKDRIGKHFPRTDFSDPKSLHDPEGKRYSLSAS